MENAITVSVITAVRNRTDRLQANISTWLDDYGIDEVVVVDWGSDTPIKLEWPRTVVVRAEATIWNWETALNLAAKVAYGNVLLQLDVDYCLYGDFVAAHIQSVEAGKSFVAGYSGEARNDNERHLSGLLMVSRPDFEVVGGYNENLMGYGYGDQDITKRLRIAGLTRHSFDYNKVEHIAHGDKMRMTDCRNETCEQSIRRNKWRARRWPWNADCKKWCDQNMGQVTIVGEER